MTRTVLAMVLCAATSVLSQPGPLWCENNGAYNTSTGTATCGGFAVSVKALVCGDSFSQTGCVAKWVNDVGENEWIFYMGAGSGMSADMLPAPCAGVDSNPFGPPAMVRYWPDKKECSAVAYLTQGGKPDPPVWHTSVKYTPGSTPVHPGSTPASITLIFAGNTGYFKITCDENVINPVFATIGNTLGSYQVETTASCSGLSPPGQDYRCLNSVCVNTGPGTGISNGTCAAGCGPAKSWACVKSRCVPAASGGTQDECMKLCKP